jgi:hypothetical protein
MKTNSFIILLAALTMVLVCCAAGSAAVPLAPANQTSNLYVNIGANCVDCQIHSNTDLVFLQGEVVTNPLGGAGAAVGYFENTDGDDGNITYSKTVTLDTSGMSGNNLETTRTITYDNGEDGIGDLSSDEMVLIAAVNLQTTSDGTDSFCTFDEAAADGNTTSAGLLVVLAGSEIDGLKKGVVKSDSDANIVSSVPADGMSLTYNVEVDGLGNQTENDTMAEGKATVFVGALVIDGAVDDSANKTTLVGVGYQESVTVDGLIELAMNTGYSTSNP